MVSTRIKETRGIRNLPVDRVFALPRATGSGRGTEVTRELSGTATSWRQDLDWGRQRKKISGGTICTNIVLVGSELTTFRGDSLEVLLGRSVGITNLQKKTIIANGLSVELLDDFLADITRFKAAHKSISVKH